DREPPSRSHWQSLGTAPALGWVEREWKASLETDLNSQLVGLKRLVAAKQYVVAPGDLHPVAQHRPQVHPHPHTVPGRAHASNDGDDQRVDPGERWATLIRF